MWYFRIFILALLRVFIFRLLNYSDKVIFCSAFDKQLEHSSGVIGSTQSDEKVSGPLQW